MAVSIWRGFTLLSPNTNIDNRIDVEADQTMHSNHDVIRGIYYQACLRRAMPTKPSNAEPNNQAAAGIGTA